MQLVDAALPAEPWEHINWSAVRTCLPHALTAVETAVRLGVGMAAASRVLHQTGLYHWARAAHADAGPLLSKAVEVGEICFDPDDPYLAEVLEGLAIFYRDNARYAEAEPLYKRAIAIGETSYGLKHPIVARRLNHLAVLYRATGRLAEAEPLLERAVAILEKLLPIVHPNLAPTRENLALLRTERDGRGNATRCR